jgi:hypothetical protein
VRYGGNKKMNETDILYPAIVIFGLLVIGLVLTVIEFTNLEKKSNSERDKQIK